MMISMPNDDLHFEWKFGDYEIVATPKRLVRFTEDEKNETIDFCKWYTDESGKRYKYSVAYFIQDKDGEWDLHLVGDRFFELPESDWNMILRVLKMALATLNEFSR